MPKYFCNVCGALISKEWAEKVRQRRPEAERDDEILTCSVKCSSGFRMRRYRVEMAKKAESPK